MNILSPSGKSKWRRENDHEPIISREQWKLVQELVKAYKPVEKRVNASPDIFINGSGVSFNKRVLELMYSDLKRTPYHIGVLQDYSIIILV